MPRLPPAIRCLVAMLWYAQAVALIAADTTDLTAPIPGTEAKQVAIRIWLPADTRHLAGVIVGIHGMSGDWLGFADRPLWRSLAQEHGFALVGTRFGTTGNNPNQPAEGCRNALLTALSDAGKATGHPELANVPLCCYGFSAGGGFAVGLARNQPQRVIAFAHNKGQSLAAYKAPGDAAAAAVPGIVLYGSHDEKRIPDITSTFQANRAAGALWQLAVDPGMTHTERRNGELLALAYFARLIPLRLTPDGNLRALAEDHGWYGADPQPAAFAASAANLPEIGPLDSLPDAAKRQRSWFPDRATALTWQAACAVAPLPGLPDSIQTVVGQTVQLQPDLAAEPAARAITWSVDGQAALTATIPPFTCTWQATPGVHTIVGVVDRGAAGPRSASFTIIAAGPGKAGVATLPQLEQHPVNVRGASGTTATFRLRAGGTPPLRFQWLRNGCEVVDPTGRTAELVLSKLAPGDDGAEFRCVVSNAAGSIISPPVWLQVAVEGGAEPSVPPAPSCIVAQVAGKPVLQGTAPPLSTIRIRVAENIIATAGSATDGHWEWPVAPVLRPGRYELIAVAENAAGQSGAPSPAISFTVPASAAPR